MSLRIATAQHDPQQQAWPRIWRFFVVAIGVLILSACRTPLRSPDGALPNTASSSAQQNLDLHDNVQQCSYSTDTDIFNKGELFDRSQRPTGAESYQWCGSTNRPAALPPRTGKCRDWANDEFLVDGGDMVPEVRVRADWEVLNLEPEETVAHFDTLDGRTIVEPSNRVCIYAPRFCAVRKIEGLAQNEQSDHLGDVNKPVNLARCDELQEPVSSKQQIQPVRSAAALPPLAFISKQGDGAVSEAIGPEAFQGAFQPYENLDIIRTGQTKVAENDLLLQGVDAAVAWYDVQAVQVILDNVAAQTDVGVQSAQVTYTVDQPPANPKLRLIKIASQKTAKPGEVIDFTLRFDNVGNQPIGNVTLLDNLTTRLEFVPSSAQCSLPADFIVEKNSVGSDILRWEIKDPLDKSAGGIIRFKCRVR